MIKILIVDDHKMVIEGIQMLFDQHSSIRIIGSALSGNEALKQIAMLGPEIVLMDVNMPVMDGIQTTQQVRQQFPDVKVIALTMHKELSIVKMMMQQGARGYVLKNAGLDELIEAIETVSAGGFYVEDTLKEVIQEPSNKKTGGTPDYLMPKFSRREKEILSLIIQEYTTQEIADKLCIGFGTVETHRRNMLIKSGARNTIGLVKLALDYKLV
jgi:DNA-binding NarL/FixJ family response regulator